MGMKRNMARHAAPAGAKRDNRTKSRYVPALDGLRAFAVLAVIVYHMGLGWAPGGLMGVTVFFVISGYLINGLLVAEREQTGTISLTSFWMRRIRRLFPAIFLSVVGTAALCTIFDHTLLDKMRPDIAPSLLFYNNWWQIFGNVSYFEAAGASSPLKHFWSLSIEEQFYVVWPLLLLLLYRIGCRNRTISRIVVVLAVLSTAEMALLFDPMGDPSRVYYGTDTRALSLLAGAWLAFAWPSAAFGHVTKIDPAYRGPWRVFNVAGILALVGLIAMVVLTDGYSSFSYYGGIAAATILSALLIAVLATPASWLGKLFALKPLVWIGKRSYGMYLWHFPILLLTTNPNSTTGTPWWMHLVQLALIFLVAALSFTFVEDPIRKGKIGAWWRERKARKAGGQEHAESERAEAAASNWEGAASPKRTVAGRLKVAIPACCFAGLLAVAVVGLVATPRTDYASQYANGGQASLDGGQAAHSNASSESGGGETSSASGESESASSPGTSEASGASASASSASASASSSSASSASASSASGANRSFEDIFGVQQFNASGKPIFEPLLIGDSVAAGAEDTFHEMFPTGHIDAAVARNIWESPYPEYRDAGQAGTYIVICLGTNNAVVDWQIDDELLAPIEKDKKIFMVNTRNTQDWMDSTNAEIARAPERHPNVTVIDWYGASAGHDEYFAGDGTHLTDEGAHAYMQLIRDAIAKSLEG